MTKIRRFFTGMTMTFVLVIYSVSANAEMYGVNAAGEFFIIDVTTGAGTSRGTLPLSGTAECCEGYNEISFDAATGTAWAQERNGNFRGQAFDMSNNAPLGSAVENGASWHAWEFIGPVLYAAGFAGILDNGLATMDPAIGIPSVSIITDGTWDIIVGGQVFTGLAFDGAILYGITNGGRVEDQETESSLYTIDPATGVPTLVGLTGIRAGSLEFGDDGNLYAGGVSEQAGGFFQVDTVTGTATLIGPTGFAQGGGISGLMRAPYVEYTGPAEAAPVPSGSTWSALLLILGLGLLAYMTQLRRQRY